MTIETNAAPGAAAEQVAPVETANLNPEVAAPESNEAKQQQPQENSAQDDSDKSLKRLQRRIDRVTAARYQAEAEARQLREQLSRVQQQPQPQELEQQGQQIRPEDVDRIASERAQYMREMESVSKRSTEIRDELMKEVGDRLPDVLSSVIEEAGPLARADGRWTPLGEAIADCEAPAAVLKFLADNPDTAAELNGLSATRLGRRLDAIERQIKEARVSKAPAPLKPVTTNKGAPTAKAESDMTDAEWYAARRKRS